MDKRREYDLAHRRTVEKMIETFEENEAKDKKHSAAIHLQSRSNPTRIGPANDLLRFIYILDQQYQKDSHEDHQKAREDLLEYLNQNRPYENLTDDDGSQEDDSEQPELLEPSNPVTVTVTQPSLIVQPRAVIPPPSQSSIFPSGPSQPVPRTSSSAQVSTPASEVPIVPATDSKHIQPRTLEKYTKLLLEARQYEQRYATIQPARKNQFRAPLNGILNRIRVDTFDKLYKELLEFLSGHSQTVGSQTIRIDNEEERLLSLTTLAALIFSQLLGSDLNDGKANTLLPLVGALSGDPGNKEFSVIFLDSLHKKCPYTVPYYPKREATMDDTQYLKALGYIEIPDGHQRRLETESEFLNRMSGLIRLFCKLLARRGPPFDENASYAWTWLADVCNLPPQPNTTAVLLRVFLDEAGQMMEEVYSKSFLNLVRGIQMKFLPTLTNGTGDSEISRLRLTLDKILEKSK